MAGGFPLQKWASNATDLHQVTPEGVERSATQSTLLVNKEEEQKTWTDCTHTALGLHWSPHADEFQYSIDNAAVQPPTKRSIVSRAAQLFDPLGWLTPVIARSKIAIQSTWLLGLGWDDPLPPSLADDWTAFCAELKLLEKVRVPRPLSRSAHPTQREMHGFADASERAYAAVLYHAWNSVQPISSHDWHRKPPHHWNSPTPQCTYGQIPQSLSDGFRHIQAGGKHMWQTEWRTSSVEFPRHSGTMWLALKTQLTAPLEGSLRLNCCI